MILAIAFLTGVFATGKKAKQKWIIYKTLKCKHWKNREAEIKNVKPAKYKVVFLGNSLTELFDLNYYFKDSTLLNCGIVGDFSEGLLKRANDIIQLKPEKLFIEIGINDMIEQIPLEEICKNYDELIKAVKNGSPQTKIFIQSNLPVILRHPSLFVSDKDVNELIIVQNNNLQKLADKNAVVFINLHTPFLRSGYLKDLLIEDGVHLTNKAYGVWRISLLPYLY